MPDLDILYEDNHLLVVNKPAGIATMGAESGPTVHSMAADYLKRTYHKPGRAYVGVVSRLDAVTSGVLVLARTSKAAARLSAQFANTSQTRVSKIYLAGLAGQLDPPQGDLVDFVRKDDLAKRMRVVGSAAPGAQQAQLRYLTVGQRHDFSIVAVQLLSGRKHQIRLQFADRGHAVIGDRKYGSSRSFSAGVALHSWRLQINHPTKGESMWFEANTPRTWKPFRPVISDASKMRVRVAEFFNLPTDDAK
jgi:23S rRNA pseudouridine1911/1915/1917 synthase